MYVSTAAWEADRDRFIDALPGLEQYGQLGTDGPTLLTAIESIQGRAIIANSMRVPACAVMRTPKIGKRGAVLKRKASMPNIASASYFTPELLTIPEEALSQFIADTPALALYRHYFDETARMRPHTLSEAEEKLLAMASDPLDKFDSVFTAIDSSDLNLVPWLIATATRSN